MYYKCMSNKYNPKWNLLQIYLVAMQCCDAYIGTYFTEVMWKIG